MADIESLINRARDGQTNPVQLLVGAESFLVNRAVSLLRAAATREGVSEFNEDLFHARETSAAKVVAAARTLPMMAPLRFVLVRGVEAMKAEDQGILADYLANPSDSACVVLTASKLDGRGKLGRAAKKLRVIFEAKPVRAGKLRAFAERETRDRGHTIAHDAVALLVDSVGEDLAALDDALERLSLYAGAGQRIDAAMVQACVTRIRIDSIWALVDAIGLKDQRKAIGALSSLLADREPPLRLLAMVARQLRIIARMREALAAGSSPEEATRVAGAPPFKARELTMSAKRFSIEDLSTAFSMLGEADRALKGSKRPPDTIIQQTVLGLCR